MTIKSTRKFIWKDEFIFRPQTPFIDPPPTEVRPPEHRSIPAKRPSLFWNSWKTRVPFSFRPRFRTRSICATEIGSIRFQAYVPGPGTPVARYTTRPCAIDTSWSSRLSADAVCVYVCWGLVRVWRFFGGVSLLRRAEKTWPIYGVPVEMSRIDFSVHTKGILRGILKLSDLSDWILIISSRIFRSLESVNVQVIGVWCHQLKWLNLTGYTFSVTVMIHRTVTLDTFYTRRTESDTFSHGFQSKSCEYVDYTSVACSIEIHIEKSTRQLFSVQLTNSLCSYQYSHFFTKFLVRCCESVTRHTNVCP